MDGQGAQGRPADQRVAVVPDADEVGVDRAAAQVDLAERDLVEDHGVDAAQPFPVLRRGASGPAHECVLLARGRFGVGPEGALGRLVESGDRHAVVHFGQGEGESAPLQELRTVRRALRAVLPGAAGDDDDFGARFGAGGRQQVVEQCRADAAAAVLGVDRDLGFGVVGVVAGGQVDGHEAERALAVEGGVDAQFGPRRREARLGGEDVLRPQGQFGVVDAVGGRQQRVGAVERARVGGVEGSDLHGAPHDWSLRW